MFFCGEKEYPSHGPKNRLYSVLTGFAARYDIGKQIYGLETLIDGVLVDLTIFRMYIII